jgi:glycyl-tRNA synthetase beta chain
VDLTDLQSRVMALNEFLNHDAAAALAAANKRISNILKKQPLSEHQALKTGLLTEAAEQNLYQQLVSVEQKALDHFAQREYLPGLNALAELRPVVDTFFDDVMVMVDDEALRLNRLALLQKLADNFLRVADFSRLQ